MGYYQFDQEMTDHNQSDLLDQLPLGKYLSNMLTSLKKFLIFEFRENSIFTF